MKVLRGKRESKVQRVTEYLKNELLGLPHGGKLPGVRDIMAATGTGRLTVHHVLESLRESGRIRIDPRHGIFRINPQRKTDEIRLFHWLKPSPETKTSFSGFLLRKLQECAEAAGRKISIQNAENRLPEELVREVADSGITRCIVCSARMHDFAECLKRQTEICLELLPRHTMPVVPALRNSPDMTVKQMDYLFNRGYRKIGYLHCCGDDMYRYPIQVHRLMDYYRLMAENGLRVDPGWVFHCSDLYENLDEGMRQILSTDPKPEALIVPGRLAVVRLFSWCRKNHVRIGKDLGIFCCDEAPVRFTPDVTTITNNPVNIAETFWEMFLAAERGEPVQSRYTELSIRTGQTLPWLK